MQYDLFISMQVKTRKASCASSRIARRAGIAGRPLTSKKSHWRQHTPEDRTWAFPKPIWSRYSLEALHVRVLDQFMSLMGLLKGYYLSGP